MKETITRRFPGIKPTTLVCRVTIPAAALISCAYFSPSIVSAEEAVSADQPAQPKEDFLAKGTDEYRHRHYSDAANDLGAALPSEFNNPLLHYYYANCMVHLRHKNSAIREYRIAYALQPAGTIGEYCKLCLDRFGIDAEGKKGSEPKAASPKSDTKKTAPDVPEPPSATELAALKANPKDGSLSAIEREKSVENLRDLMLQKKRLNGAPLPTQLGTNLFVRSYKGIPASTKPQPTTAAAGKNAVTQKKFSLWWW